MAKEFYPVPIFRHQHPDAGWAVAYFETTQPAAPSVTLSDLLYSHKEALALCEAMETNGAPTS